jgi:hypothetical protein
MITALLGRYQLARAAVIRGQPRADVRNVGEIERLIRLQRLVFIGSSISDAGLAHLKGLNNLSTLYLDNGQVTDAGLEHLKGLTKLRMLCFARNRITEAESAKIREAFPKVTRIVVRVKE